MAVKKFSDDCAGYREWLQANPTGFVINTTRTPRADYLKLHRADCENGILAHQDRNPTVDLSKFCSTDRQELASELMRITGGTVEEAPCCFRSNS